MEVGVIKKCLWCGEVKPLTSFHKHSKLSDGRRPECKDCSKAKKEKSKLENPLEHAMKNLSANIYKRIFIDINKPKNKCYKEKNIKCLIGNNTPAIYDTLNRHYRDDIKRLLQKGLRPSVDRIDPDGHYELGNIQIVDLVDNINRSRHPSTSKTIRVIYPNETVEEFPSISAAARKLKCKRDTIYYSIEKPGVSRKGLRFELIS
jgi:hypothetical protein